ncbi:hypothetical protein VTK26DRAFT_176 [Humicola hyalothermophila]
MASQAAARLTTPANVRTIIVKVRPTPATLSERRAVLRALKRHGEIQVFKKLHDASSFVSVADKEQTVAGLVEKSPLQFDYVPEHGHQAGAAAGTTPDSTTSTKTFTVTIQEQPNHMHRTRIRESLLYGRWPEQDKLLSQNSLSIAALRWSVPRDLAWAGLVDWESHGQLDGPGALGAWLDSDQDYVQARTIRQKNKVGFDSLVEAFNSRNERKGNHKRDSSQENIQDSKSTLRIQKAPSA